MSVHEIFEHFEAIEKIISEKNEKAADNIDLNNNGNYGDPNEGYYQSGDEVNINGKIFATTVGLDKSWSTRNYNCRSN